MTIAQLPVTRSVRCGAVLDVIDAQVDQLLSSIADHDRPAGDLPGVLAQLERLRRRIDAARLRLIAVAECEHLPARGGHATTSAWVARHTRSDGRAAAGDAMLAEVLGNGPARTAGDGSQLDSGPPRGGPSLCPRDADGGTDVHGTGSAAPDGGPTDTTPGRTARDRSPTGVALDEGRISAEHAKIIVRTLGELPAWVTGAHRTKCEESLVRASINRSPSALRPLARRILQVVLPPDATPAVDAHESATLRAQESRAVDACAFWIRDNHDGTMTGNFTVPTLAGVALRKIIDTMVAPRRRTTAGDGPWASTPAGARALSPAEQGRGLDAQSSDLASWRQSPTGQGRGAGTDSGDSSSWRSGQLDWQHRRGVALTELLEHLPTDHLHAKNSATVVVSTRLADLEGQLERAGHTDTGHHLSPGEVRRISCGAGIVPVVLGTTTVPIDLGRSARLFSASQRIALASCYTECAAEHCNRPFAWSELHHRQPWSAHGSTDLGNAIALCGTHHRMIHGGHDHTIRERADGTCQVSFHRRT